MTHPSKAAFPVDLLVRLFIGAALLAMLLAGVSFGWPGSHVWGGVPLRLDGFEKPLVIALALLGLAWFARWYARHAGDLSEKPARRWLFWTTAAFTAWFTVLNGLRCALLTIGYDMGTYTNILANTMQGRWFLVSEGGYSMLGEHWMVASLLAVPLLWLLKSSVALVIFEVAAVSLSLGAVYHLARLKTGRWQLGLLFAVLFLSSPYLHRILMDPYRPITLAIPVFLWALVALETGRRTAFWALVFFSFFIQENTPIFWSGLGAYLFLFRRDLRWTGLALGLAAAAALALVMGVGMPHFFGGQRLQIMNDFWSRYQGNGLGEIAWNILKNPFPLLASIFKPAKTFQMIFFTATVGFLCVFRPRYLLLFLGPMIFYQMTDFMYMNNFSRHYSSDPLVGVFYASILAVSEHPDFFRRIWQRVRGWRGTPWAVLAFVLVLFSQFPDYRITTPWAPVVEGRAMLHRIPERAAVCCTQGPFFAPLAFREKIKSWPNWRGAEWVLISRQEAAQCATEYAALQSSGVYEPVCEGSFYLLFKKR